MNKFTIEGRGEWCGLFKVMEECGELITVCAKLCATGGDTRYWGDVDLRERLIEEIGDVMAAVEFFITYNMREHIDAIHERKRMKRELFEQWRNDAKAE